MGARGDRRAASFLNIAQHMTLTSHIAFCYCTVVLVSSRMYASFCSAMVECILLAPSSVSLSINPSIHPELRAYCF